MAWRKQLINTGYFYKRSGLIVKDNLLEQSWDLSKDSPDQVLIY
jgi:hypothetical protein